ncbi:MAG: dihydrolipoamide acetyltransferase family protein [Spirochaetota bacterium]
MHYQFRFPDVGEGVQEGRVLQWNRAPGDQVREGDILVTVETDKVVAEIPSPRDGVLAKQGAAEGRTIRVGDVLAVLEVEAGEPPAERDQGEGGTLILPPSDEGVEEAAPAGYRSNSEGVSAACSPEAAGRRIDLSPARKAAALNLEKSREIPAAVVYESVLVDKLVRAREAWNRGFEPGGDAPRLSYLPFFLRAAALALGEHGILNAWYDPRRFQVELHDRVHLGFAVDTTEGLVVPVVRNVRELSLAEIQEEVTRLTRAARSRTLGIGDIRGATFTLSVYGSIGGLHGIPMIPPPQVAVLGVGRVHPEPAVVGGEVRPAQVLPLSLVIDHRVVDGAAAVRFLNLLMDLLSDPSRLTASTE